MASAMQAARAEVQVAPVNSATVRRKWRREAAKTAAAVEEALADDGGGGVAAAAGVLDEAEARGAWYENELLESAALAKYRAMRQRYGAS
ncbi:uncharacterized protein AMSG_05028 [Thecamonas trahens ATCC 50062]|uniref:Uncharacterized protein n=1 Tax=Thecamonas trahens ATCC 50062 TaxID=461836 RepID=A0A0L0D9R9_THETB|nr:hypothetical protein AMSG_05028 [Thecamonas trahens ATCC 50062]KNC49069.1 hypothetical protein AMSG_05028 [Thecamonas trahens ATCC 50062]|eukprot:XP_013758100.1 hypothetical protein AMSG_05028 [Thecamonas trahens ATCC 50062]